MIDRLMTRAERDTTMSTPSTGSLAERLGALGLSLPPAPPPAGAYIPARRVGELLFIAGQLPFQDGVLLATGPVPSRCSVESAAQAARQCVLNALSAALAVVEPDRLVGVVRVGAFIASDDGFTAQPKVANAASELLQQLFGEPGRHARAAVGVNVLPLDASVEIEFLFQIR